MDNNYQDKTLVCRDCGAEFVFSAGEQAFYAERGFATEPTRCAQCRRERKERMKPQREMYEIICADCGAVDKIPFEPLHDRPVYCSSCYPKHKHELA